MMDQFRLVTWSLAGFRQAIRAALATFEN